MFLFSAVVIAIFYSVLVLFQVVYVWLYRNQLKSQALTEWAGYQPSVTVVLCLRGMDPSLDRCLKSLAKQNYPSFQLVCVVDDLTDRALESVRAHELFFPTAPSVICIQDYDKHRSLKCSALLTAFEHIRGLNGTDLSNHVIALVDADTFCDENWLRDLVAPLQDDSIGATCGNRWFSPQDHSIGSWLRHVWNAAAIVQMYLYRIAWGGSLAFRADLLSRSKLIEHIETSFCEDTGVNQILEREGLALYRVPTLVLNNSESTSVANATNFISRQLFNTRMYHTAWPLVAGHGLMIFCINLWTIGAIAWGYSLQSLTALTILVAGFTTFQVVNLALLVWIGQINQSYLCRRWPAEYQAPNRLRTLAFYVSAFAIQVVHPWALIRAACATAVNWRGITYRVIRGRSIEMIEYRPFSDVRQDNESIE